MTGPTPTPPDAVPARTAADTGPDTVAPGAVSDPALADMRDRWQRSVAELDNARKRFERELAQQRLAERARVVAEWLPVLDNLERALKYAGADPEAIVGGVAAVHEQALAALARLGFTRIEEVGVRFDPQRHEAALLVDSPEVEPGTIVAVLQPGYLNRDGLLRPAAVAVARGRD